MGQVKFPITCLTNYILLVILKGMHSFTVRLQFHLQIKVFTARLTFVSFKRSIRSLLLSQMRFHVRNEMLFPFEIASTDLAWEIPCACVLHAVMVHC